jgi:hypothetical protein
MADPREYDDGTRPLNETRETAVETPTETAHRRGLITGLVVGVIGGAIVGGIIVGMIDQRPAPTQPVATVPERDPALRQDRILGTGEPDLDTRREDPAIRRDPAFHEPGQDPWAPGPQSQPR